MSGDSIEFETALDLYRDRNRRVVLAVLANEQRPLTLTDLTRAVDEYTHRGTASEAPSDASRRIRISLHHIHLPKLAEAGLVDYDPEEGVVEPTEKLDRAQPQLSALVEADADLEATIEL